MADAAAERWTPSPGAEVSPRDWVRHAKLIIGGKPGLPHVERVIAKCNGSAPLTMEELRELSKGHAPGALDGGYLEEFGRSMRRIALEVRGRLRDADAQRQADKLLEAMCALRWFPGVEGIVGPMEVTYGAPEDRGAIIAALCDVAEYRAGIAAGEEPAHAAELVADDDAAELLEADCILTPHAYAYAAAQESSSFLDLSSLDRKVESEERGIWNSKNTRTPEAVAAARPATVATSRAGKAKSTERRSKAPTGAAWNKADWKGVTMPILAEAARMFTLPGELRSNALPHLPEARQAVAKFVGMFAASEVRRGPGARFSHGAMAQAIGCSETAVHALFAWAREHRILVEALDPWGAKGFALDRARLEALRVSHSEPAHGGKTTAPRGFVNLAAASAAMGNGRSETELLEGARCAFAGGHA